jgi:hypothetical protein
LSVVDEALDDVGFGLGLEHGWEANGEARASSHDNTAKRGLLPVPLQIVT